MAQAAEPSKAQAAGAVSEALKAVASKKAPAKKAQPKKPAAKTVSKAAAKAAGKKAGPAVEKAAAPAVVPVVAPAAVSAVVANAVTTAKKAATKVKAKAATAATAKPVAKTTTKTETKAATKTRAAARPASAASGAKKAQKAVAATPVAKASYEVLAKTAAPALGHVHSADGSCCGHDHSPRPKHIYIYSPSGAVRDKAAFKRGVNRLLALGHEVEVDDDALSSHQRFAGDDATRLAAIHRAADSGADLALISRGGYGLTRILPGIKYKAVAKAIEKGTQFVGLSDFTAFQTALLAKTGAISWAGPALNADFGVEGEVDDIMLDCFEDLLCGQGEGAGWQMPKPTELANGKPALKDFYVPGGATLWGGNLAVLVSLLGTPYFPQIEGGILFIEDVGEHPYRIERMLTQLLQAGVLAKQKAIVFGQFTEFKLNAHDKGFKLQTVIDWLRLQVKRPVLQGLPFGHVSTKVLLPVGAQVSLSVEGRDALVYWGHLA